MDGEGVKGNYLRSRSRRNEKTSYFIHVRLLRYIIILKINTAHISFELSSGISESREDSRRVFRSSIYSKTSGQQLELYRFHLFDRCSVYFIKSRSTAHTKCDVGMLSSEFQFGFESFCLLPEFRSNIIARQTLEDFLSLRLVGLIKAQTRKSL